MPVPTRIPSDERDALARAVEPRDGSWAPLQVRVRGAVVTLGPGGGASFARLHRRDAGDWSLELAYSRGRFVTQLPTVTFPRLLEVLPRFGRWAFQPFDPLRCPCCAQPCAAADQTLLVEAGPFGWTPGWAFASARGGELRWACHRCLADGRALRAAPARQSFGLGGPILAFFAVDRACRDCGEVFTFTAAEQRRWYEDQRRFVASTRSRCERCTHARRVRVQAARELEKRLPVLDGRDVGALLEVARLHAVLGRQERAGELVRRARNRADEAGTRAAFEEMLARLNAEGAGLPVPPLRRKP